MKRVMQVELFVWEFHGNQAILVDILPHRGFQRIPISRHWLFIDITCFNKRMGWLQSLVSPVKKLWIRLHSAHKKKRGIYILYEDVKSCPYEDVHVLWSILAESHAPQLQLKQ
ncbi:hypothetical protein MUK42_27741 [Musa troglodytarum]|uniref:Uncharacterized protein n=1 Tax=Musa troglodytarum TaxID=320322 RepID=A0A9E7F562_9LILI|nr:hypothetical protein MUK42_27741 [Musa troglodytarum]